jgi:hypothetical protein
MTPDQRAAAVYVCIVTDLDALPTDVRDRIVAVVHG